VLGSAIYYLLTPSTLGALHRLKSDEIYHFYIGDPVRLTTIEPSGVLTKVILGSNLLAGERVQHLVPAGTWQGAALVDGGEFALLGCSLSPGWEQDDYEAGNWEVLLKEFPSHHATIMRLTRG
jgi:predicted cupin superfamily sugar epimerase